MVVLIDEAGMVSGRQLVECLNGVRQAGGRIASASTDGAAKIWDVTSGRELLTDRHK